MAVVKAQEGAEKLALNAASERARHQAKQCACIAPLLKSKPAPRLSTLFQVADARSNKRKIAGKSAEHQEPGRKQLAKRRKLTPQVADVIMRVAS